MKKRSILLIFLFSTIFFASCGKEKEASKVFSFKPEKPTAGEEITVNYMADSTNLSSVKNIDLLAYLYSKDLDNTIQVEMHKNGKVWTGKFSTTPKTRGVLVEFIQNGKEENYDNNNKKGYLINLYDKDGNVVPGSYAGYAAGIITWGSYYVNLDRDPKSALKYIEKDFSKNPSIRNEYLKYYVYTESLINPAKMDSISSANLDSLATHNPTTEDELVDLALGYRRQNPMKATKYFELLQQKYPKSDYVQKIEYSNIYNEPDINKKLSEIKEYEKKFPDSKYIANVYDLPIKYYVDNNSFGKVFDYLKKNSKKVSTYSFYNVANIMMKRNQSPRLSLQVSELGVKRSREDLKNPIGEKPIYESTQEWKEERKTALGMNLYMLGKAQYALSHKKEAQKSLGEAVELTEGQSSDLNDLYAKILIDNKEYGKALDELSKFIRSGNSTSDMKDLLKTAYVKKNKGEKGFSDFEGQFELAAHKQLVQKLKKEMVDKPAPNFTLKDLNGKEISLSSLKGKTVVVDFWATWCGPCKSSFPGMKEAVEKYSKNKNVKFLFVNTWENVKDKEKNAEQFIKGNNYPFHVLLDEHNQVVAKYKVSGIPTKFVIDKDGNIRFVKVGFSGNTDEMVDEISTMISMLN